MAAEYKTVEPFTEMEDIDTLLTSFQFIENYRSTYKLINEKEIAYIRRSLLTFYKQRRRLLPWRGDTVDGIVPPPPSAYGTWVSEIMLQQTRVETVIQYWHNWMKRFPTISDLAQATPDEVNAQWAGLGYYRRAQNLLLGAKKVCKDFGGVIPDNVKDLLTINGVGPYTAGAIASIAFQKAAPLVDGNVIRVFSRLRAIKTEVGNVATDKDCWALATQLVDPNEPGDFNQALMELGATVCKPTSPSCETCPLQYVCRAKRIADHQSSIKTKSSVEVSYESDDGDGDGDADGQAPLPTDVTYFPRKSTKKAPREVILSVLVLANSSSSSTSTSPSSSSSSSSSSTDTTKYLFVKRPSKGLLANQWEFPSVIVWEEGQRKKTASASTSTSTKANITTATSSSNKTIVIDLEDDVDGSSSSNAGIHIHESDVTSKNETAPQDFSTDTLLAPFPTYLQQEIGLHWTVTQEDKDKDKDKGMASVISNSCAKLLHAKTNVKKVDTIVHIFSHQKHTMHVSLQQVDVVENSISEYSRTASKAEVIETETETKMKTKIEISADNLREHRWMTAAEIIEAGVTSGCKKILNLLSPSSSSSSSSSATKKRKSNSNENGVSEDGTATKATTGTSSSSKKTKRKTQNNDPQDESVTAGKQQKQTKLPFAPIAKPV